MLGHISEQTYSAGRMQGDWVLTQQLPVPLGDVWESITTKTCKSSETFRVNVCLTPSPSCNKARIMGKGQLDEHDVGCQGHKGLQGIDRVASLLCATARLRGECRGCSHDSTPDTMPDIDFCAGNGAKGPVMGLSQATQVLTCMDYRLQTSWHAKLQPSRHREVLASTDGFLAHHTV